LDISVCSSDPIQREIQSEYKLCKDYIILKQRWLYQS